MRNESLISSKIIKELRSAYAHVGLNPESDIMNYLQFVMILQFLNYINKQKATDQENVLLVDAWNSLKTRTIKLENINASKEGVTFYNFSTFIHVINYIFPAELLKHVNRSSE
jgi:hypothetical protein